MGNAKLQERARGSTAKLRSIRLQNLNFILQLGRSKSRGLLDGQLLGVREATDLRSREGERARVKRAQQVWAEQEEAAINMHRAFVTKGGASI